jgi:hypothetical protein
MFKKLLAIFFTTSAIFGSLNTSARGDLTVVRINSIGTREVDDKLVVYWQGSIKFDYYNLKWSRTGKAEKVVTGLNKAAADKRQGSYYIKNPVPDAIYNFEVQGCESSRVNSQVGVCTQWKKTFHRTSPKAASNNLPYGAETCKQGFVWREATAQDKVCVTPETRERVKADNAQETNRREPNGAYGPNTCKQGYVWRETIPSDYVCVTPEERSAATEDNSRARDRRVQP